MIFRLRSRGPNFYWLKIQIFVLQNTLLKFCEERLIISPKNGEQQVPKLLRGIFCGIPRTEAVGLWALDMYPVLDGGVLYQESQCLPFLRETLAVELGRNQKTSHAGTVSTAQQSLYLSKPKKSKRKIETRQQQTFDDLIEKKPTYHLGHGSVCANEIYNHHNFLGNTMIQTPTCIPVAPLQGNHQHLIRTHSPNMVRNFTKEQRLAQIERSPMGTMIPVDAFNPADWRKCANQNCSASIPVDPSQSYCEKCNNFIRNENYRAQMENAMLTTPTGPPSHAQVVNTSNHNIRNAYTPNAGPTNGDRRNFATPVRDVVPKLSAAFNLTSPISKTHQVIDMAMGHRHK